MHAGSYPVSVENVSPQNGVFIWATELAEEFLLDFHFEIERNLSSSQRKLLENYLLLDNLCKIQLLDNSF